MPIRRQRTAALATAPEHSSGRAAVVGAARVIAAENWPSHAVNPHVNVALYRIALHSHLSGWPVKEIDFFVNPRRFRLLERLIGHELTKPDRDILNVASGPFALEFYCELGKNRIVSFDREPQLWNLHLELTGRKLIGPSTFEVCDAQDFVPPRTFDIVVINDLFYSRHVDFYEMIARYIACLKPGGILYFDIQDERAGPVWRAFGKDSEFRRYDLARVRDVLEKAGLTVEAFEPALGIKGAVDAGLRKGLWRFAGIANSFVFVARKG